MTGQETELDNSTVSQEPAQKANTPSANNVKIYSNRWMAKVYDEKPPFPEELFNSTFSPERLTTIVKALKQATDQEVEESARLLEDNYTYSLQITSHKVPHVNVHLSRVLLKHSLLSDESEICLFVKDLKRGRRLDFEPTIQHYEKLLRANKVKHSITVIPLNQLYNEYATFELRRKLSFAFDKFLVDGAIAAHVNGFLGTKMLSKGRIAFPVNLGSSNLVEEIDNALRKVCYKHLNRGVTQSIQVGKHSMSDEEIAENVIDLVRQIGEIHPGGYENVHKLHLRPQLNLSVAIPIYVSLDKPRDGVPTDTTNKETLLENQAAKAEEILDNFDITAAARLVQKRRLPLCRYGNIINDEHRLSDDESTAVENPHREGRTGFNRSQLDGNKKAKLAAEARNVNQTAKQNTPRQNTPQQTPKAKQGPAATPNKTNPGAVAKNNTNNVGNANNRPVRNLNGVSAASRAPISKQKRPNNNNNNNLRGNVQNMLRNSGNAGNGGGFRKNDMGGSNFNRGGGGFDRNNDSFEAEFTRRSNLGSGGDFSRGLGNSAFSSLGLGLGIGSPWSGNSGGGNFGRNFNNGNRF